MPLPARPEELGVGGRRAAPRARRRAGAGGRSARSRGRGSRPRLAGPGSRRGGGRRTGRARPRRRCRRRGPRPRRPARPHICRSDATVPGKVTTTAASSSPMSIPSSSASVVTTARSSPRNEPLLELAALLGRVAGAVGRRRARRGPGRWPRGRRTSRPSTSTPLRDFMKQIVRAPPRTSPASSSAASPSAERRVPSASSVSGGFQIAICRRGAGEPSLVDQAHVLEPGQALGELDRVGDRRRGEQEARLGAVGGRDPAQAAQHVGDVRAEHAAVHVRLVDDDEREVARTAPPTRRGWAGSRRAACRGS